MNRPTPEQTSRWRADGVVPLPGALSGEELSRLQEAFSREAAEARPGWLQGVEQGTRPAAFFDIPDALPRDPLFLDLVDHPSWYGHLMAYTGGQATFLGAQFRTLPPAPLSYVGWHYDVPRSTPLHLKVQLYLDPVSRRDGAFAYVPGSHHPESGPWPLVADPVADAGPPRLRGRGRDGGRLQQPRPAHLPGQPLGARTALHHPHLRGLQRGDLQPRRLRPLRRPPHHRRPPPALPTREPRPQAETAP